jgi:tetratricopeptide (TPR) repeat protein
VRRADAELRGPGQRAAIDLIVREYENLRTALRRAVAAGDEQEVLVMLHSLVWDWQMHDLRDDSRYWAEAACELGPDPFAPPVRPAPPVYDRCTDAPPPMRPELLEEARRGARLIVLASAEFDHRSWSAPQNLERMNNIVRTYRPGLPQTCRMPGALWFFSVMLTREEQLNEILDETVQSCRDIGFDWELAVALQLRANVLANRSDQAGGAVRDADEALSLFTRIGDAWGAAEALSARGEAHERIGEFAAAAEDFRGAIAHAERLEAQSQVLVLRARYAGVLMEDGQGGEAETILRKLLTEEETSPGQEGRPVARMFLAMWLGRTGRTDEARTHLDVLLENFATGPLMMFQGCVLGIMAWLDNEEGRHDMAVGRAQEALVRTEDPLSRMVAPQMAAVHLMVLAWALAGSGDPVPARRAAMLLAVSDAQLPARHYFSAVERRNRDQAFGSARAVLGDEAFDAAYAEGGDLTLEEATALVKRRDR